MFELFFINYQSYTEINYFRKINHFIESIIEFLAFRKLSGEEIPIKDYLNSFILFLMR